jgi:hypothetical protein
MMSQEAQMGRPRQGKALQHVGFCDRTHLSRRKQSQHAATPFRGECPRFLVPGCLFHPTARGLSPVSCHQVWEIPPIEPTVIEYQHHRGQCDCWGITTFAELPCGEPKGQCGPGLAAFTGLLIVRFRISKPRVSHPIARGLFQVFTKSTMRVSA